MPKDSPSSTGSEPDKIKMVADTIIEEMFAPHEVPLDEALVRIYRQVAEKVLQRLSVTQAVHGRGVTDAMCEAAIKACAADRIQGFSYKERGQHVIRDVWLDHADQEIWTAPIAGPDEYQAFQRQCGIERMRKVLEAAMAAAPQPARAGDGATEPVYKRFD